MKCILMLLTLSFGCFFAVSVSLAASPPDGWKALPIREEIAPAFEYRKSGGKDDGEVFAISADEREGLAGYWTKTIAIEPGKHYRFRVWRKAEGIESPRKVAVARIHWRSENGEQVLHDEEFNGDFRHRQTAAGRARVSDRQRRFGSSGRMDRSQRRLSRSIGGEAGDRRASLPLGAARQTTLEFAHARTG